MFVISSEFVPAEESVLSLAGTNSEEIYIRIVIKRTDSYKKKLSILGLISMSTQSDLPNCVFMFKIINNVIDCVDLVSRVNYRVPARYPRIRYSLVYAATLVNIWSEFTVTLTL